MRISIKQFDRIGSRVLRFEPNCETDALPMVTDIEFRRIETALDPQTASIAAALLFARYCGEIAEFVGVGLTLDHTKAIKAILPNLINVAAESSSSQAISTGDVRVLALPANEDHAIGAGGDLQHLVTWSGDPVSPVTRTSIGHRAGQVFTNAELVAGPTAVSVALGLLFGGGLGLREICVPASMSVEDGVFDAANRALREIGIVLTPTLPA